jgi:Alternative complex III, ActD subunit
MSGERPMSLLGVFPGADRLRDAALALTSSGFRSLSVYSPVPLPEIEGLLFPRKSPVRMFTLLGGFLGCVTGFWVTIWSSEQWNLITGGKPIASLPPFVLIAFELTILFGTLATLVGVLVFSRLPVRRARVTYDTRFSEDRYGLVVTCAPSQTGRAEQILKSSGAEEVRIA